MNDDLLRLIVTLAPHSTTHQAPVVSGQPLSAS